MSAADRLLRAVREPGPPPACPEGWSTAPPDFVGVGAQRCGTTRWYDLIVAHPRVVGSPAARKELHYFDRFHVGGFGSADAAAYASYFPRPEGSVAGEWTPTYLADFWTIELLAASAPDVRVLVSLRDPVDRYLGAMWRRERHAAAAGMSLGEDIPLLEFTRGLYGEQMTRLLRHVDPARVLVLQFERCRDDPRGELRRTFRFLGLPEVDLPDEIVARHPNRQPPRKPAPPALVSQLVEAYRADVQTLTRLAPAGDLGAWPSFA